MPSFDRAFWCDGHPLRRYSPSNGDLSWCWATTDGSGDNDGLPRWFVCDVNPMIEDSDSRIYENSGGKFALHCNLVLSPRGHSLSGWDDIAAVVLMAGCMTNNMP